MTKFISTMFVVSVQKAPVSLQSYAVSWPCNTNLWLLQIHTRSKSAALCPAVLAHVLVDDGGVLGGCWTQSQF